MTSARAHDAGDGETVAHGLAEAGQVRGDAIEFLRPAQAQMESGANLVKD